MFYFSDASDIIYMDGRILEDHPKHIARVKIHNKHTQPTSDCITGYVYKNPANFEVTGELKFEFDKIEKQKKMRLDLLSFYEKNLKEIKADMNQMN